MKKHIPNFITTLNIVCGAVAIIIALEGSAPLYYASIFIAAGAVFDFMDGMFARLLKAYSPMGKELDSLADMLTFGMAPTAILYVLMKHAIGITEFSFSGLSALQIVLLVSPLLIAMFSGLRLAKFNVDTRQTESFIGLPTPANAIFIGSFPLILAFEGGSNFIGLIENPIVLGCVAILQSFLLVCEIPMFSLKFKSLALAANKLRYIFLLSAVLLFLVFGYTAFALIIVLFIVLSIINNLMLRNK